MDALRPIGPTMYALTRLMGGGQPRAPPDLPGHKLANYTSLTVLAPNAQVMTDGGAGR